MRKQQLVAYSEPRWVADKNISRVCDGKNQFPSFMFIQPLQHYCQKLLLTFFIIIALLLTGEAHSATGYGDRACSKWNRDRAAAKQQNPSEEVIWEQLVDQTWLMGYLSGLAVTRRSDFLKKPGYETLVAWIDNYCTKNPRDSLGTASTALSNELENEMKQYEASR